jgi:hypothetical protein
MQFNWTKYRASTRCRANRLERYLANGVWHFDEISGTVSREKCVVATSSR